MTKLTYTNVFDALNYGSTEAADLQTRADLMLCVRDCFRSSSSTVPQFAKRLGISAQRIEDLLSGEIDKFTTEELTAHCTELLQALPRIDLSSPSPGEALEPSTGRSSWAPAVAGVRVDRALGR